MVNYEKAKGLRDPILKSKYEKTKALSKLMAELQKGEDSIKAGRVYSWEEVMKKLGLDYEQ
ncbi:MAG: hypothetical protein FWB72_06400 [Firmicutes bacterium]|nr:hypothetical protein [Bacillota bacterium]